MSAPAQSWRSELRAAVACGQVPDFIGRDLGFGGRPPGYAVRESGVSRSLTVLSEEPRGTRFPFPFTVIPGF